MYMARQASDENPTWSRGRYEPALRHYVKYDKEFRAARSYAMIIRSRADWEKGEWRLFDPALAVSAPVSLLRHVRYVCETGYVKIQSALRRPGRVRRFARFIKRMLGVRDLLDDRS